MSDKPTALEDLLGLVVHNPERCEHHREGHTGPCPTEEKVYAAKEELRQLRMLNRAFRSASMAGQVEIEGLSARLDAIYAIVKKILVGAAFAGSTKIEVDDWQAIVGWHDAEADHPRQAGFGNLGERDALWCLALTAALDTKQIHAVTSAMVNRRPEMEKLVYGWREHGAATQAAARAVEAIAKLAEDAQYIWESHPDFPEVSLADHLRKIAPEIVAKATKET